MKKMNARGTAFSMLFAAFLILFGCKKDVSQTELGPTDGSVAERANPVLPAAPFNYASIALPAYMTAQPVAGQNNTPANNQISNDGATLGRVLFYDKALSVNNAVACASCHQQASSFSDPAQFSTGVAGQTTRNSMSLLNARYYQNGRFFWDERAASAEAQATQPIINPIEMGMTIPALLTKLQGLSYYPPLFQKAFGSNQITEQRVQRAIAQFVRSMYAFRSKYDTGRAPLAANANVGTTNFANFTATENAGKALFFGQARCNTCHSSDAFTLPTARNNGLDLDYADNGKGEVTGNPADNGLFKSPSLRGIETSAPFMHDGRFATLEQVVEHYNSGVKAHPNLSPQLRNPNGTPRQLNLNATQKAQLVAFLKTLTDTGIAADVKYSSPF